jgi:hypothetical protein
MNSVVASLVPRTIGGAYRGPCRLGTGIEVRSEPRRPSGACSGSLSSTPKRRLPVSPRRAAASSSQPHERKWASLRCRSEAHHPAPTRCGHHLGARRNSAAIRDKEVLMLDGPVLGLLASPVRFPSGSSPAEARVRWNPTKIAFWSNFQTTHFVCPIAPGRKLEACGSADHYRQT